MRSPLISEIGLVKSSAVSKDAFNRLPPARLWIVQTESGTEPFQA